MGLCPRRTCDELACDFSELAPGCDCLPGAARRGCSGRLLDRILAMAVEIPGGSHRRVAAGSASHGTRILHAGGAWSEESGGQVCRIGVVHSTDFLVCTSFARVGFESAGLSLVVERAERLNVLTAEIRLQLSSSFRLDCAFEIPAGFTVLFGPSGAGKTSVLDCIAGIKTPDSGKIAIDGKAMFDSSQGLNLWPSQRRLAYVFQSLALFPHLSVAENV